MALLKFGTLGAARITPRVLVHPVSEDPEVEISVVAARDRKRGEEFAAQHGIGRVADSYEAVVEDPDIDAVYVPLPVTLHCEWTVKALEAGKHVLTEKAFCANATEARRMADAAHAAGRVCMEAFHYHYHPVWTRLREIIGSGVLGDIERVEGAFDGADLPDEGLGDLQESRGRRRLDDAPRLLSRVVAAAHPGRGTGSHERRVRTEPVRRRRAARGRRALSRAAPPDTSAVGYAAGAAFDMHLTVTGTDGRLHAEQSAGAAERPQHRVDDFRRHGTQTEQADLRAELLLPARRVQGRGVERRAPGLTDAEDAVQQMAFIDAAFRAAGRVPYGLEA